MALTAAQQAFVDRVAPYALEASKATGIDARLIVAQAAVESAWGTAAPGNNYFGIKALGTQPSLSLATTEYYGGSPTAEQARFRTYDDPAASTAAAAPTALARMDLGHARRTAMARLRCAAPTARSCARVLATRSPNSASGRLASARKEPD